VILSYLQGESLVRQRSIFADLIFGYFVSRQVTALAAIERYTTSNSTTVLWKLPRYRSQ
jgi:hypothetical protein